MKTRYTRIPSLPAILLVALVLFAPRPAKAAPCASNGTGGGNWGTLGTWDCGHVPGSPGNTADTVTIRDGDTVTINAVGITISGLTVGEGTSGILQFEAASGRAFTVNGDVTIASGGPFRRRTPGHRPHPPSPSLAI
jgi:hypothetical protein